MQSRGPDKTCLNVGPRQSAQLCTRVCHREICILYCLAVQVGLYSDVVECPPVTRTFRVQSPVVAYFFHLLQVYKIKFCLIIKIMYVSRKFIFIGWIRQKKKKKKKKNLIRERSADRQSTKITAYPTFIMLSAINSSPCIIPVKCCRNVIHFFTAKLQYLHLNTRKCCLMREKSQIKYAG